MEDRARIRDYRHNNFDVADDERSNRGVHWHRPRHPGTKNSQVLGLYRVVSSIYNRFVQNDDTWMESVCSRIIALSDFELPPVEEGAPERPLKERVSLFSKYRGEALSPLVVRCLDAHPNGSPHLKDQLPYTVYTALQQVAGLPEREELRDVYHRLGEVLVVDDVGRCRDKKKVAKLKKSLFSSAHRAIIERHVREETHPDRPSLRDGLLEPVYNKLCKLFDSDK